MTQSEQQKTNILLRRPVQTGAIDSSIDTAIHSKLNGVQHWHTHTGMHILVVTDGSGYYQEKGKDKQVLQSGDVIFILPQVSHWHTAACGSEFTDVVIPGEERTELVTWVQKTSRD